jgi:hypothetical protein
MGSYILVLIITIACTGLLYYSGQVLKEHHGDDIRIIWYFFSLTFVISYIIGLWATSNGAIDSSGSFVGEAGDFINKLLTATLDIKLSIYLILAILALILIPQFMCYLLSGIFGVASSPLYISESIKFLIWGLIKTFIIVSGVTAAILLFGSFSSWKSFELKNIFGWSLISLAFCFFSFMTLLLYRESEKMLADIKEIMPNRLLDPLIKLHNFFTRHSANNT